MRGCFTLRVQVRGVTQINAWACCNDFLDCICFGFAFIRPASHFFGRALVVVWPQQWQKRAKIKSASEPPKNKLGRRLHLRRRTGT